MKIGELHYHIYRPEVDVDTGVVAAYHLVDSHFIEARTTANHHAKKFDMVVRTSPTLHDVMTKNLTPEPDVLVPAMVRQCFSDGCAQKARRELAALAREAMGMTEEVAPV